jgi:hypothetical protein
MDNIGESYKQAANSKYKPGMYWQIEAEARLIKNLPAVASIA